MADIEIGRDGPGDVLDGRRAWTVAFLLFLSQIVNYFDKGVMGLAAPDIMRELGLSTGQYALVASSFFSLYAVSGVFVGLVVAHRVRSKPLLLVLVAIWSLAQLPVVAFSSLGVLVAARVMLGVGEGPASPTATSAALEWFSDANRNMPTALLMLGSSLGSVIAAPVLAHVMAAHGWRAGFLLCSGLGVAWMLLWALFGASGPRLAPIARPVAAPDAPPRAAAVPLSRVWLDPTIIGCIVAGFAAYWVVGFSIAWQAPLIRTGLGYDAVATGWIVAAVQGATSAALITISYASQRLLKRGVSSRIARAGVNAACLLAGGAAFLGAALVPWPVAKLVLLALGGALALLTFTLGPAIVSEVAPPVHRNRLLIAIYAGITVAGFVSPIVAGRLIGDAGLAGYDRALLANAAVVIAGGIAALFLLRPEASRARLGG